jgi:hypothetical protein
MPVVNFRPAVTAQQMVAPVTVNDNSAGGGIPFQSVKLHHPFGGVLAFSHGIIARSFRPVTSTG